MYSFEQFLNENYKNFIGVDSRENRLKWVDQAWEILQQSYKKIGGIKGNGFKTKQDMVDNIPFWKLYTKGEHLVVAAFYKDKGGRKAVAIGTDGSNLGKKIVADIFKASLGTSYGEKSGASLGTMMKIVPFDVLENFIFTPEQIEKVSDERVTRVEKYGVEKLDEKDRFTYNKFPMLRPYFYLRELGGEMHLKVAIGTPGIKIIPR